MDQATVGDAMTNPINKVPEPFWVHCGKCSHEWVAAYLPMPIKVFVKLGKAPCPMCGANKVLIGPMPKQELP